MKKYEPVLEKERFSENWFYNTDYRRFIATNVSNSAWSKLIMILKIPLQRSLPINKKIFNEDN